MGRPIMLENNEGLLGIALRSSAEMSGPRIVYIRIIEACNAGCFMCGFASSRDNYRFTLDDARGLAAELAGSSIALVRFTGGEPLSHEDLPRLLGCYHEVGIKTSVITNGWNLFERADALSWAGLGQVIVSLDAATAEKHDRFRNLEGLFVRAVEGIRRMSNFHSSVVLRVNTVAGPHNVAELTDIHTMLAQLGVDQWAIIPLKREDRAWKYLDGNGFRGIYDKFRSSVVRRPGPRLLGSSLDWAGRDDNEISRFLTGRPITPNGKCALVDRIRYYTPKNGLVYPCNCIPHRINGLSTAVPRDVTAWTDKGALSARAWLRENGPRVCMGCEPTNVSLGEEKIDLDTDPFGF